LRPEKNTTMNQRIKRFCFVLLLCMSAAAVKSQSNAVADTAQYLASVKKELNAVWPDNRTINIVFHGHSVPAGYWHNHEVHTLESYPNLLLKKLKQKYPYAVINIIVTAIGGENAIKGQSRFEKDVLPHKPDVLIIDYALNDRFAGLEKSRLAWEQMIQKALQQNIPVLLLTPSPDQRIDITEVGNDLEKHAEQIRQLAARFHVGLADPFAVFQKIKKERGSIEAYMSHVNHPNEKGHDLIAAQLLKWF